MTASGNIILIFGIFVFYSFIGWGIAELYHEPDYDNSNIMGTFITEQDSNFEDCESQDFWTNLASDNTDCGALSKYDPFYYIAKVGTKLTSSLSSAFNVMIYNNPHIPTLVNILIITPFNVTMLCAGLFLARGGGS